MVPALGGVIPPLHQRFALGCITAACVAGWSLAGSQQWERSFGSSMHCQVFLAWYMCAL